MTVVATSLPPAASAIAPGAILLVDDEPVMTRLSRVILEPLGIPMYAVGGGLEALEFIRLHAPRLVVLDNGLPDISGLEVLTRALAERPELPIIMVTGASDAPTAVRALRLGASDYLTKPVNHDELLLSVERALERRRLLGEVQELRGELGTSELVKQMGPSPEVAAVAERVHQVASSSMSVLLLGETGVGKEVVARAIHAASGRARKPFVAVDCGAIPEALFESELFGHEEGAFTGARRRHRGHFQLAEGGTLFLDEIGNLSAASQAKLLRVLEERKLRSVGGGQAVDIDVRIVAATNESLEDDARGFRRDLYYRLAEITIPLPPLRARRSDIPYLALRFCDEAARELGREVTSLDGDALAQLLAHDWPGNVRELRNTVRRAVLLCSSTTIRTANLLLPNASRLPAIATDPIPSGHIRPLRDVVDDAERSAILAALAATGGRRGDAARRLDVDAKTLYRKMQRLGLTDGSES